MNLFKHRHRLYRAPPDCFTGYQTPDRPPKYAVASQPLLYHPLFRGRSMVPIVSTRNLALLPENCTGTGSYALRRPDCQRREEHSVLQSELVVKGFCLLEPHPREDVKKGCTTNGGGQGGCGSAASLTLEDIWCWLRLRAVSFGDSSPHHRPPGVWHTWCFWDTT